MPPQTSGSSPAPPPGGSFNQTPSPDYSFLYEKPKRRLRLPISTNSRLGRIAVVVAGLILLFILYAIFKALLANPAFNKTDYLYVVERQQEMIHILTVDITSNNASTLSPVEQNFVATATLTLGNDQTNTLNFMSKNGDKTNAQALAKIYSSSVDNALQSSISTNSLASEFQSVMQTQLDNYLTNLKTAYSNTRLSSGKSLLSNEYKNAQLLIKSLNSQAS